LDALINVIKGDEDGWKPHSNLTLLSLGMQDMLADSPSLTITMELTAVSVGIVTLKKTEREVPSPKTLSY
jgi:hypothetical protein